jgi:hypothetical protein
MSLAERMNAPRVATVQISNRADTGPSNENHAPDDAVSAGTSESEGSSASPRRKSLLQRITGLEKPVA